MRTITCSVCLTRAVFPSRRHAQAHKKLPAAAATRLQESKRPQEPGLAPAVKKTQVALLSQSCLHSASEALECVTFGAFAQAAPSSHAQPSPVRVAEGDEVAELEPLAVRLKSDEEVAEPVPLAVRL